MQTIQEIKHKNLTIKVFNDEFAESPREFECLGTMVCSHKRYDLGDKNHQVPVNQLNSWKEVEDYIKLKMKAVVIVPMFMLDHSGLTIASTDFNDPWDSGRIGFNYVTKDQIRKYFGKKRISQKMIDDAKEILENEIKVYSQYVSGNAYMYTIVDESNDEVDSCSGYYDVEVMISDAKTVIDNIAA